MLIVLLTECFRSNHMSNYQYIQFCTGG